MRLGLAVMSGAVPWVITTIIAALTAAAGWARVLVERGRNKMLQRQLELAEKSRLPEVRIVDIQSTGGSPGYVDFSLLIQNIGARPVRAVVSARVGDHDVLVPQPIYDLTANTPPSGPSVRVPRPQLGELMKECGHATTLYGRPLTVTVSAEGQTVSRTWDEVRFDPQADNARYEIQQSYWRRGRGDETDGDLRADWIREREERIESGEAESKRLEDV